jgi:diaminopropionate ammonia-lyase
MTKLTVTAKQAATTKQTRRTTVARRARDTRVAGTFRRTFRQPTVLRAVEAKEDAGLRILLRATTEAPAFDTSDRPIDFHRRLPGYEESRLVEAPEIAKRLGVAQVFVKTETSRFGLPSFKILGASWATYAALRDRLGPLPEGDLTHEILRAWAAPARPLTLIAATDGNHGRAVARVAKWLGLEARIFVPNFVSPARCQAITAEGAELVIVDGVYDASVDAAVEAAKAPNTLLISDTARSTDDAIPQMVTAGYTTAYAEVEEQLARSGNDRIDVVSVQAGVGGLASATTQWARVTRKDRAPRVVVSEPENAACVFAGLEAGKPVAVAADRVTEMAVLQCGTMSLTAFPTLNAGVSCSLAIEDSWALTATALLRDAGVHTGPSGAAGTGGLLAALSGARAVEVRNHLGLTAESRILLVATEAASAGAGVAA